jgi:hypothetical protein
MSNVKPPTQVLDTPPSPPTNTPGAVTKIVPLSNNIVDFNNLSEQQVDDQDGQRWEEVQIWMMMKVDGMMQ